MDGSAEAHNISSGCGRLAINIRTLSEDMIGGRWRYQLLEQRSEKSRGVGCHYPFFHLLSNHPHLLHPSSAERHESLVLLVAL